MPDDPITAQRLSVRQEAQERAGDETATSLAAASQPAVIVIQPSRGWLSLRLRDLWEYRELLYFLTWRDVAVRYKQTMEPKNGLLGK